MLDVMYKLCIGCLFILSLILFFFYIFSLKIDFNEDFSFAYESFSETAKVNQSLLYFPVIK